jgi:ubiquinone/menaquinone biosynthesis C-methylase UbiE
MVAVASQRWGQAEFRVADACALPFKDGSLAGYRADKVLHALDEPWRAVAEARRVLTEGGRAVLAGQDWDTFVVDSDLPEVTRRVVRARAEAIASPLAARSYRNLLLDAGFREPTVEVYTMVFTDETGLPVIHNLAGDAGEEWVAEQRERARRGRLFLAIPMFLVSARC